MLSPVPDLCKSNKRDLSAVYIYDDVLFSICFLEMNFFWFVVAFSYLNLFQLDDYFFFSISVSSENRGNYPIEQYLTFRSTTFVFVTCKMRKSAFTIPECRTSSKTSRKLNPRQ